jgi:hypothetical protein
LLSANAMGAASSSVAAINNESGRGAGVQVESREVMR